MNEICKIMQDYVYQVGLSPLLYGACVSVLNVDENVKPLKMSQSIYSWLDRLSRYLKYSEIIFTHK